VSTNLTLDLRGCQDGLHTLGTDRNSTLKKTCSEVKGVYRDAGARETSV
jgi:hypothetical protein